MFSESDEDEHYTVHNVDNNPDVAPQQMVPPQQPVDADKPKDAVDAAATLPLARYYRLGTQQRHAFDEHMRRLKEEAQRAERDRKFRQQHPFHPHRETTDSLPFNATPATPADVHEGNQHPEKMMRPPTETINSAAAPVKPVFDRLAAQAVQLELRRRHREEQKRRAEAAALRDAFQPAINRKAPMYAGQLRHLDDVPVEERLLHYGEVVARERQRRQEVKAMEEKAALEAAQADMIGGRGASRHLSPAERQRQREEFEKRNQRLLAAKEQHHSRAAQEAAGQVFSFQPQISATSAALDEARRRELMETRKAELQELLDRSADGTSTFTVNQRSTSGGGCDASRRSDLLYEQAIARQRQQCRSFSQPQQNTSGAGNMKSSVKGVGSGGLNKNSTLWNPDRPLYQPQINPTSDRWIANGPHRIFFEQDFVRRQELYGQVKEEEAALSAAAIQNSFSPSAGGAKEASGSYAGEVSRESTRKASTKELNERLYYSAKIAGEVAQRRRAASLNARECPFRPELSPGTQHVMRRLRSTRNGDVVKRLTSAQSPQTSQRRSLDMDPDKKDLYEPAPTQQRSKSATAAHSHPSHNAVDGANGEPAAETASPDGQPSPQKRTTLTRDQVEHFYQRQMTFLQERQDLIQERKEGEAAQELVECTFRPRTNTDRRGSSGGSMPTRSAGATASDENNPSLRHVTGVSSFLERQSLARQRRAEHDELVRTLGRPRSKLASTYLSFATGTTLLNPFTLQTAQRRRRSSCTSPDTHPPYPQYPTLSPARNTETNNAAASPKWVDALATSERALYDSLVESKQYPTTAGMAPLFPLPGYTHSGDDDRPIYVDELNEYANEAAHTLEDGGNVGDDRLANAYTLRASPRKTASMSREPPSLFSSLSPTTFSGRRLGSTVRGGGGPQDAHPRDGRGSARSRAAVKPSALKNSAATAELASSSQRRKQKRTVSFAVDGGAALPRTSSRGFTSSFHVDPMRGSTF
jgi:hypothetical protein